MKNTKVFLISLMQLSLISSHSFACGGGESKLRGSGEVISTNGMMLYEFKFDDGPQWVADDDGLFTASLSSAYCAQDVVFTAPPSAKADNVPLPCAQSIEVKNVAHKTTARFLNYRKPYDNKNSPQSKSMKPERREAYLKELDLYEKSLKDFENLVENNKATKADFRKWSKNFGQLTKDHPPVYSIALSQDMNGAGKARLPDIDNNLLGIFVPEYKEVDMGTLCNGTGGKALSSFFLEKISVASDAAVPSAGTVLQTGGSGSGQQ